MNQKDNNVSTNSTNLENTEATNSSDKKHDRYFYAMWSTQSMRGAHSRKRVHDKSEDKNIPFEQINLRAQKCDFKLDEKTAMEKISLGNG